MKKFYYTLVFVILISSNIVANGNSDKRSPSEKEKSQLSQNLRGSGLCFTPNKGQIADMNGKLCPDILYKGDGGGADIYLRKTGISYVYTNMGEVQREVHEKVEALEHSTEGFGNKTESEWEQELMQKESIKIHRVDMDFAGCLPAEALAKGGNSNITAINEDEVDGYNNYYYAHCPNGILNVKQYYKVTYKNIYKGIDIAYYGNSSSLSGEGIGEHGIKYDLIVQPHADPNQIKLHWKGAQSIHINREGNLVIKTSLNEFRESIPKVYQVINGTVIDVAAEYKLSANGIVSFSFGEGWDEVFPLIIDPWATYYGGTGTADYGYSVACDNTGSVYLAGSTNSPNAVNVIATAGGFQTVLGGWNDAFLVKFNSATGARTWATYYGGTGLDVGYSVACDNTGNVYLAGETKSPNAVNVMATAGGFQTVLGGGLKDAFLVKFNSTTGARTWATYYGDTGMDIGNSVACDNTGNVYLAGTTTSPNAGNVIATAGGFQTIFGGNLDAFLVKFNSTGVRTWATYYGGTGSEWGNNVACDNTGNVYLAGTTNSPNAANVMATAGGFQTVFGGGSYDAFLVKFDPATGARTWATYYGGTGEDVGYGVACDNTGNVYLAGLTKSPNAGNVIATAGGFQTVWSGIGDAFLVKFDSATGARTWGTYYSSNWNLFVTLGCLAIDGNNNVYLYLEVEDSPAPAFIDPCAYQPDDAGGGEEQIIVKFSPAGQKLCATYFGGSGYEDLDWGGGIAVSGNLLFICTSNKAGGYPVTPGAHQTVPGGGASGYDAVLACLCINICEGKTSLGLGFTAATSVCANTPVTFTPTISNSCDTTGYRFHWIFTGGVPATSDSVNPTVTFSGLGTHDAKLVVTTLCKKDSITKTNYITINSCGCLLSANTTAIPASCGNNNGTANVTAAAGSGSLTYLWNNGQITQTAIGLSAGNYTVTVTDAGGCTTTATAAIIMPPPLMAQFTKGTANCLGCGCKEWIMVNAAGGTSPYSYSWPDGYINRYRSQLCPGVYIIKIKDKNGCIVDIGLNAP